jgi:hypothetical protein
VRYAVKSLIVIMLIMVFCAAPGCTKKPEVNSVDLEQIDIDDSNDYRYIFRDTIQEQEERNKKYKKKEF